MYILFFEVYNNCCHCYGCVYAVFVCSELYGQVLEDDTANIAAFSRISDAADRHVHFSKARTWRHCL